MNGEEKRQDLIKFLNQELTNAALDCQLDQLLGDEDNWKAGLAQGIKYALTHSNEQISMMLWKGAHGVWEFSD